MIKLHTPPPPGHITAKDYAKTTGVKCIPAMFPKPHNLITDDRRMIHFPPGIQPLPEFLRDHYSLKNVGVQLMVQPESAPTAPAETAPAEPAPAPVEAAPAEDGDGDKGTTSKRGKRAA